LESGVRQDLSKQQVEVALRNSGFATAAVADVALNAFFERREIQTVNFLAADYSAKVNPTDAELETFYKANLAQFQAPEQARVEYVVLDLDAIKKGIQIPEGDLKAFYDQNAAQLSGKEERRASHILVTAPKDAPAKERDLARARAQQLLQAVKAAPGTFADVAKKNSQDPGSAAKGGDLDFFGRGAMVKPFEDAAFSMKKGDISGIVESDFGFHIILLTDIKAPKTRSFEELRAGIESDLKTQQAQKKYAEVAEVFTNTVYEQSDSLKPVADKLKLEIKTVDGLGRNAVPGTKGPLASDKFLSVLFVPDLIEKKRNTEAIETAVNQLVAGRVVAYQPARALPLAEVRQKVRDRVAVEKATEMARAEGIEKLSLWKTTPPASGLSAPVLVSRDQAQDLPAALVAAALRAPAAALPAWTGVDLGSKGYAVVRVNKVLPPSEVAQTAAQQNRNQYAQWWTTAESLAYYAVLKEKYKAEVLVADPAKPAGSKP
jgi:peptidyl-prolyl cis-trans isomerase D